MFVTSASPDDATTAGATTAGATSAGVTTNPASTGGLITSSFPPPLCTEAIVAKYLASSMKGRLSLSTKTSAMAGLYSIKQIANMGIRVVPSILPVLYTDGDDKDQYLATVSNNPTEAVLFTSSAAEVNCSTIRFVSKAFADTVPKEFPRGAPFKYGTKQVKKIKGLLPNANDKKTEYCLIVCPNAFPICPGARHTAKGKADDAMNDLFRTYGTHALAWLRIMSDAVTDVAPFSLEFQKLVLKHKADLGDHFPDHKKSITTFSDSNTISFLSPPMDGDEDDEDEPSGLKQAMDEMRTAMRDVLARNTPAAAPAPPPVVNLTEEVESLLGGEANGMSISAAATQSLQDRMSAKLRLLCASVDEDGNVILPDLDASIRQVITGPKPNQPEAFANLIRAANNTLADSMDAINRFCTFPASHLVTKTILVVMLNSVIAHTPLTDLQAAAAGGTTGAYHVGHFLPQGAEAKAAVASIASQLENRMLQVMLDEATEKVSKVNTKTICSSYIPDWFAVLGTCANVTVILRTLAKFDTQSIDKAAVPFLHRAARELAITISSRQYADYQLLQEVPAKFNYFVFSILDRILVAMGKILQDENAIQAAMPNNGNALAGNIPSEHYKYAEGILDNGISQCVQICTHAISLETPELFLKSPFNPATQATTANDAKKRSPADQSTRDKSGNNKRLKQEPQDKRSGANVGAINCSERLIPDIPYPTGVGRLCIGTMRNRSKGCSARDTCQLNHDHPSKWPASLLTVMKQHVANHDFLSWNYNVASPELLGMQYSTSATNQVP